MRLIISGMRFLSRRRRLLLLLRLILALLFAVAATWKVLSPMRFVEEMSAYGLVPNWAVLPVSFVVPTVEIGFACALLLPGTLLAGALGLLALTSLYTVFIFLALVRGLEIPCGCFPWESGISAFALLRNGIMLFVEGTLALHAYDSRTTAMTSPKRTGSLVVLAVLLIVCPFLQGNRMELQTAHFTATFGTKPIVVFVNLACAECESCLGELSQSDMSALYIVPVDVQPGGSEETAASLLELTQTTHGLTRGSLGLFSASRSPVAVDYYLRNPSALGLSEAALQCLSEARERVVLNGEIAQRLGITAVPAVYIGGRRYFGNCDENLLEYAADGPP